jgi:hypothetical protein
MSPSIDRYPVSGSAGDVNVIPDGRRKDTGDRLCVRRRSITMRMSNAIQPASMTGRQATGTGLRSVD